MSKEQLIFVKKIKNKKRLVILLQILICISFLISWELLSKYNVINSFIFSSPSACLKTLKDLGISGDLFTHIFTTLNELFISFSLGIGLGMILAIWLYSFPLLNRVVEPFLTMLNSLPKVALGPILIIWFGANTETIIVMSLLINLIVSTITILNGFNNTDYIKLKLLKTFGANKIQILRYLVIPGSLPTIISAIKLNISMSLIGLLPPVGENFIV